MNHKAGWAVALSQLVNVAAVVAGMSSPHTATIIGASLAILQVVCPSVFPGVNETAAK